MAMWNNTVDLFNACIMGLGRMHLVTLASETALQDESPEMLVRAMRILHNSPFPIRSRVEHVLHQMYS